MVSSVSSERAFSSAGITITKRRNRLKADVVEALQGLKCMIKHDLLFREHPTVRAEVSGEYGMLGTTREDGETRESEAGEQDASKVDADETAWDTLVVNDPDAWEDLDEMETDDVFVQNLDLS